MTRHILALVSDTHAGHEAGLANPAAEIVDLHTGETHGRAPNARRDWLWGHYAADVAAVLAFAGGAPITLCHLGDATHGNARPEDVGELAQHAQVTLAAANMEPWRAGNVTGIELVAGTSWHEFSVGNTTALLMDLLQGTWPGVRVQAHQHPLVAAGGVVFDLAHHGPPPGSRKWLEGNGLRLHVKDRMMRDLERGHTPPQVMAFGHYHTLAYEVVTLKWGGNVYTTTGLLCAPYCLPGAYAVQASRSTPYVEVGVAAFACDDGRITDELVLFHEAEQRRKVTDDNGNHE